MATKIITMMMTSLILHLHQDQMMMIISLGEILPWILSWSMKASITQHQTALKEAEKARFALMMLESGFRNHIFNRVWACLLSPDISGYILRVTEPIMALIAREPHLFDMPEGFLEYQFEPLHTLVIDCLSQHRGTIQSRIAASLEVQKPKKRGGDGGGQQIIQELCKSLATRVQGMEIKGGHLACVAFLQVCLVKFRKLLQSPSQGTSSVSDTSNLATEVGSDAGSSESGARSYRGKEFWVFVDKQLMEAREDAKRAGLTLKAQQDKLGRPSS
ncbi:hypothetical protein AAF712_016694 [Marasmius tenuissimus]|uniref:Uncharacterized protein n=1 Tax=Marasmius tenuissimus TaxID=585030 RepID=A0ABR2Z569_9AGAR